jgi:methylthioribose-1-phosphate isomerase
MKVQGRHYRTIWLKDDDAEVVQIIDQRALPFAFVIEDLRTVEQVATSIRDMHVRGAGLIGVTAAYGMYIAALEAERSTQDNAACNAYLEQAGATLKATRPTAVNLEWAVQRQLAALLPLATAEEKVNQALATAQLMADEDAAFCKAIGQHGLELIRQIAARKADGVVNILTHCNAGWLAFVDYGSATSPIYAAHDAGIRVHVWVDETRPRNQGARLTAWELSEHGVAHTVIADNAGGHLMQHGMVDLVITGADRVTYTGDAANKIGTYLKALAARDNGVPFYVALPSSTFDWKMRDGVREIPIEQRHDEEVKYIEGLDGKKVRRVLLTPPASPAANFGFDVTPARLITGLITERGICGASEQGIAGLYPRGGQ